jgi:hypothetical protein
MSVICPQHYKLNIAQQKMLMLTSGNLSLELLALSLNSWVRAQTDYGTPMARQAAEIMLQLSSLPPDLQVRAIAMIYNEDAEALVGSASTQTANRDEYRSTGASGFTEDGVPDDYDVAAGSVLGYRTWQLQKGVLLGAYGGDWPAPATSGHRYIAKCKKPQHDVPDERSCGCGFWAYWLPPDESSVTYNHTVIGAIEGSGKIILGENGFRSRYAVIRGLALTDLAYTKTTDYYHDVKLIKDLKRFRVPVYANSDEMALELGTDQLYSPLTRDLRVFTSVPSRDLKSYLMVLENASVVIRQCTHPMFNSLTHYYSSKIKHNVTAIHRELSLVSRALDQQRSTPQPEGN